LLDPDVNKALRTPCPYRPAWRRPPAWIALAQYDPLHDEGHHYCERLRAAGVDARCRLFEGMIHSFFQFGGLVPLARTAHQEAAAAMRPISDRPTCSRSPECRPTNSR
jgi:acetyl esterase/lipase